MAFVVMQGGLGFNPFSAVKSVVRSGARIVTDPNVQRAAVTAGQQLAPGQYAAVTAQANRAAGYYKILRPGAPPPQRPMMMPPPDMDSGPDIGPGGTPAQHGISKVLLFVGVGVIAFVMLTKK